MIARNARIYVAGHRGMVGSSIVRRLQAGGYGNILTATHAELDLLDQDAVRRFLQHEKPDWIVLAAAKVGGIQANNTRRAEFIYENLMIEANVIHSAYQAGVRRMLFLGSSCIYPRDCPQPIKEDYLLTGPLEATNRAYALAKIAGVEMCGSYNAQYGTKYVCAMPTNLFGRGDNYDLTTSHVLPALIRKAHEAKAAGSAEMVAWGSGTPRREFLFSDDLARACLVLLSRPWNEIESALPGKRLPLINIGTGEDLTIRELVETVNRIVGAHVTVRWDSTKPDGTPRKLLDVSRMFSLGWRPGVPFEKGIEVAYEDFLRTLRVRPAA